MSSITSLVGQPIVNDSVRLVTGTAKALTGGLLAMSPIQINKEQSDVGCSLLMSGTKDVVSSSFGFASRLTSALGQGGCKLLDGLSKGLSEVSKTSGMIANLAPWVDNPVTSTVMQVGGRGVEYTTWGTSKLLDIASSVIDSVTGHPVKAYDVYMGNVDKGVTRETTERTKTALDNFFKDKSVPEPVKTFVSDLISLHDASDMDELSFATEVLSGAHVVVEDGGTRYDTWSPSRDLGVHDRSSSHHSDTPQRGFDIPGLGHILFGTSKSTSGSGDACTWFQFEAHGMTARDFLPHMMDWVVHKASGNSQVGPLGYSTHSEKTGNQITVTPDD